MKVTVQNSDSLLGFGTEGGGPWKVWDRFITIAGKKAYHIGNICGTCSFFFQRLEGVNQSLSPKELQSELTHGLSELTVSHANALKGILPDGVYHLSLRSLRPQLVAPGEKDDYFVREQLALWGIDGFWALPHNPRTKYYRCGDRDLGDGVRLFEFMIPMFPETWLDDEQVQSFVRRIRQGESPTALAISILDVKEPADRDGDLDVSCHWCLAHYLIDGHHKVFAASALGQPISFVSMFATDQGISGPEDYARLPQG